MPNIGWSGDGKPKKKSEMQSRTKGLVTSSIDQLDGWEQLGDNRDRNAVLELLSKPGGAIDIDEHQRLFVAVVKDKLNCKDPKDVVLLVSKDPKAKPVMQLTEQLIRQAGYKLIKSYRVSPSFLGSKYEGYANYDFSQEERLTHDKKWIEQKINEYLVAAVKERASDIHFTLRAQFNTRFRIDGDMEDYGINMPHKEGSELILSFFNIYLAPNYNEDFDENDRVSSSTSVPIVIDGEKRTIRLRYEQAPGAPLGDGRMSIDVVIRIISDGSDINIPYFDVLGFDEQSSLLLNRISRKDRGILLIVGGTGSGKSTTLDSFYQACLDNSGDTKKIVVIADPPEAHVPGVNIQPLHPDGESRVVSKDESNKATIKALKSALRQDPDVLGIGEIRDPDIAKLTFESSLTGHLVGSTLHASRTFDAYTRVTDYYGFNASMMCSPGMVQAIIAQQLAPKVCQSCALTYEDVKKDNLYDDILAVESYIETNIAEIKREPINDMEMSRLIKLNIPEKLWYRDYSTFRFINNRRENDCEECKGKGKKGRVLLYEIFVPSRHPNSVNEILKGNIGEALRLWRNSKERVYEDNMIDGITLDERAMRYAKQGITCTYRTLSLLGSL